MDKTLAAKAELAIGSMVDSCRMLAEKCDGVKSFAGYEAYFAPATFWYNRVRLLPGAGAALPEKIAEIAAATAAEELPPIVCWLSCDYPTESVAPLLEAAGYGPVTSQTAMHMGLEGRVPGAVPENVERVTTADDVRRWGRVGARAFGKPPETEGIKLLAEDEDCYFLQWNESGEIVATVLLICRNGNGGIHEVGTLPEYRGRGIAGALVSRGLDIAASRGCTCATLQASDMGVPVYERLGMKRVGEVHTWIRKQA